MPPGVGHSGVVEWWIDAYRDPMFWWFPVGTVVFSMAAFALFAAPLTWLATRDPAWARPYRIQRRGNQGTVPTSACVGRWLLNNAVLFVGVLVAWPLLRHAGIHTGDLPAWWVIALQLAFFVFLDDFCFYWMHRALHTDRIYRRVHARHHRILRPRAFTGHYMHPLEYVLIASLMLLGPLLVQAHLVVLWVWIAWRQWEAADGHAGYDLPWTPTHLVPGNDGAVFHDVHHAKVRGNYAGFLAIWDGVFGTYAKGYEPPWRRGKHADVEPAGAA